MDLTEYMYIHTRTHICTKIVTYNADFVGGFPFKCELRPQHQTIEKIKVMED